MKKELLKKIGKVLTVLLVFTMCLSKAPVAVAEDGETKDIAVGTTYYIGDTINFGSELQYFDNGNNYGVMVQWAFLVHHAFFTDGQWIVNIEQNGGTLSMFFTNPDFTGTEIVKGVKCSGGTGTSSDPYKFELIYEDPVVASIKVINGTRSTDEGESGDHTVTDPEATLTFASGDYVTLGFLQAADGYTKQPIVKRDGEKVTLSRNSNREIGGGWNVTYYEAGHFPNTYPNGWIRISGHPTVSADFVVEYLPIDYKIAFDANGGEGSMDAIETKYDVEVDLPECTMTNGDLYFADWNTKEDGSGDTYYDMDSVKNLTKKDGATVTLYAQWQEYPVYVYEDIKEVSFTITPPKAGDTVTIDVENYEQNPQPEIILPSDAKYTNEIDGEVAAYWIKSEEPGESFAEGAFEGTYKAGDTFYAVVGLFIDNGEVKPTVAEPNRAVTDVVLYAFSNDLKVNVKGADVVSTEVYIYGYDEATVVVKGVIEAEPDPEPDPDPQPDPQPQPTPIVIPKTGVDGFTFSSTSSLISLLGVCLAGLFLNKRR